MILGQYRQIVELVFEPNLRQNKCKFSRFCSVIFGSYLVTKIEQLKTLFIRNFLVFPPFCGHFGHPAPGFHNTKQNKKIKGCYQRFYISTGTKLYNKTSLGSMRTAVHRQRETTSTNQVGGMGQPGFHNT